MARPIPARAADPPASRNDAAEIVRGPHRPVRYLAGFVAVVGVAAYFVALHALIVTRAMPTLTLMLILAPWVGAIGSLTAAKLGRTSSPSMRVLAVLGGVAVLAAVVVATFHFAWHEPAKADVVLYVENLAFFGWSSSLFAREPASAAARRSSRGWRAACVAATCRRRSCATRGAVTIGLGAFFVAVMALSTLLFVDASRDGLVAVRQPADLAAGRRRVRRRIRGPVDACCATSRTSRSCAGVHAFRRSRRIGGAKHRRADRPMTTLPLLVSTARTPSSHGVADEPIRARRFVADVDRPRRAPCPTAATC